MRTWDSTDPGNALAKVNVSDLFSTGQERQEGRSKRSSTTFTTCLLQQFVQRIRAASRISVFEGSQVNHRRLNGRVAHQFLELK
jgi:hypothetical protein